MRTIDELRGVVPGYWEYDRAGHHRFWDLFLPDVSGVYQGCLVVSVASSESYWAASRESRLRGLSPKQEAAIKQIGRRVYRRLRRGAR